MQQVSVTQVAALLASFDAGVQPIVLDVREPWEIATASLSIDAAPTVCIPMNEIPDRLGELPAGQPVLCLCHHGMRSLQVAAFLEHQGFIEVYNIAGGIDAWAVEIDPKVARY